MARVIKAGAGAQTARPARPATRVLAQADVKKVIEKEMYLAKQEAEECLTPSQVCHCVNQLFYVESNEKTV